jgi:hypothetical protein
MRVSDVLPPPQPSYPAASFVESEVDYLILSEQAYQALMLAEFGSLSQPLRTYKGFFVLSVPI